MGKILAKEKVFSNGKCWIDGECYKYLMISEEDFCKNWSWYCIWYVCQWQKNLGCVSV